MAKDVGGDYYIIKKYSDTNWFISVCDVSGKGISAALLSVLMAGMNHVYNFEKGFKEYIGKLNEFMYHSFHAEKFITGLFADYNEKTSKITMYDAGHSYLFISRDKRIVNLKTVTSNPPLGVSPALDPVGYTVKLKKNDLILMITDGMVEQKNPENAQYGLQRFFTIFKKHKDEKLNDIADAIFKDVRSFRNYQTQEDDMTMLLMKIAT